MVYARAKIKAYEASAQANLRSIAIACDIYYYENFKYPETLNGLNISESLKKADSPETAFQKYFYVYKSESDRYVLYAKPQNKNWNTIYTDQTKDIKILKPNFQ